MDDRLIFYRTKKGEEEIATRAHHLPHRMRAVLLLVNGVSSVRELEQKSLFELDEILERLAMEGYIAVRDERWMSSGVDESSSGALSAHEIKARLIDLSVLTLGDDASFLVSRLRDAPDDLKSLQRVLVEAQAKLRLIISEKEIQDLQEKYRQILSRGSASSVPSVSQSGVKRLMKTLKEELIRVTSTVLGNTGSKVIAKLELASEEFDALQHVAHQCESLVRLTLGEKLADELRQAYEERLAAFRQFREQEPNNVAPLRSKIES